MGLSVKHVFVVSVVLSVVGFVYVIGFAEIDAVRSPRAAALEAQPSSWRLISNVRAGMTNGQVASARAAGDELVRLYPDDPRSWLNRGYAYRVGGDAGLGGVESAELESWERLLELVEGLDWETLRGQRLRNGLYHRGWALRGLGEYEASRADFARLARLMEEGLQIDETGDPEIVESILGPGSSYNLACYWSVAGEMEKALFYWGVCVRKGYTSTNADGRAVNNGVGLWWMVDPDLEELREDDRFRADGWDAGDGGAVGGDASIGDE